MANDRFFLRCTICNTFMQWGKYYPSSGAYINAFHDRDEFIEHHLNKCQDKGMFFNGPICLVFDSEDTLPDEAKRIGNDEQKASEK